MNEITVSSRQGVLPRLTNQRIKLGLTTHRPPAFEYNKTALYSLLLSSRNLRLAAFGDAQNCRRPRFARRDRWNGHTGQIFPQQWVIIFIKRLTIPNALWILRLEPTHRPSNLSGTSTRCRISAKAANTDLLVDIYLFEFVWRQRYRNVKLFMQITNDMSQFHPLQEKRIYFSVAGLTFWRGFQYAAKKFA